MKAVVDRIIEQWDWTIYRFSCRSMQRMCERNPGIAYLLELQLKAYRERNPISPELESATEHFFKAFYDKQASNQSR